MFDAYNADEAFISSTSLGLCPVQSVNGVKLRDESIPGPITKRIMDAYVKLVDHDFVHQYLKHLDG